MNKFNPTKLLNSKWTAIRPQNKERHFIVTKLGWNEDETKIISCLLEAVINKNEYELTINQLKDASNWIQGWK